MAKANAIVNSELGLEDGERVAETINKTLEMPGS
jgi:hypothetical protein